VQRPPVDRPWSQAPLREGAGFGIGPRELAAERPERAPAPGVAGTAAAMTMSRHAYRIVGPSQCRTPAPPAGRQPPLEPLSSSEIRVLRYLPTNLTGPEIAGELSVSHNTVRTHMRHLYTKLGTHRRAEAVARARDLGLLAPSAPRR
jgi:DNA-binding CsgD family transcriptional regulator